MSIISHPATDLPKVTVTKTATTYNAEVNRLTSDGKFQLDADKEATRRYFLDNINQNTVFFHDLEEKIHYLVSEGYYEKEVLDQYSFDFIKDLFKQAYSHKFRFESYLGAYKFYSSYALKTFDGQRYLERFEDRVVMNGLYMARGDENMARQLVDEIITGRYQPATPTFLNSGKKQRGELVSCLRGTTPVLTDHGEVPIKNIEDGDKVLSHDGSYQNVLEVMSRVEKDGFFTLSMYGNSDTLELTPEHPVLTLPGRHNQNAQGVISGDGSTDALKWIPIQNIKASDFVAVSYPNHIEKFNSISVFDILSDHKNLKGSALVRDGEVVKYETIDKKNNKLKGNSFSAQNKPLRDVIPLNEDLGRLMGYYISDGYVHFSNGRIKGLRFTFGSKETEFIEDTKNLIETLFGINVAVNVNADNSTTVCGWSTILGELFMYLIGTGFDKKRLSDTLKNAPIDFLKGLLVGSFRGDGHQTKNSLTMTLTNPELVKELRVIALQIGLNPFFATKITASGKVAGCLTVSNATQENIDFILSTNKNIASFTERDAHELSTKRVDGYALYKVRGVSFADDEEIVYNLEVENTHTYNANGFIVHNCFLSLVSDDMENIGRAVQNALQLSKRGGGVAFNLSNLREKGAPIKKIENQSSGVVPVMKMLEDAFSYANQLGARQGAGAVYLNAHHPDILYFLDTKRENADEKVRIKSLSIGVVIPDITLELAKKGKQMYLFSPYDVERIYGTPFSQINVSEEYDNLVNNPDIKKKKIPAQELLTRIAQLQFESGYPYIMFEDNVNRANPIDGKVSFSNLCVTGDTMLLTDNGYTRIKDLYDAQNEFSVLSDDRVLNKDLSLRGLSKKKSTKAFKTGENQNVYRVNTCEGFNIRATDYHKFFVAENNNVTEKRLHELVPGDRLLIQSGQGTYGQNHEPERAGKDLGSKVPDFVLQGDKETQAAYLKNALGFPVDNLPSLLEFTSFTDTLAKDIQRMLLNMGVFSTVERLSEGQWNLTIHDQNSTEFFATVESVEFDTREDVYDVTVEDGHVVVFDGIVTSQCSEILQVSTPSSFNEDGTYEEVGRDISCNLGSMNVAKAFDSPDFGRTVELAVRSLTAVSDLSNIRSVPSIEKGNQLSHAIGLGQMNLHGFFGREHIYYDSKEAVDFTNIYFYSVLYAALRASHKIAVERNETFYNFAKSKYADGSFFDKYIDRDWSTPKTDKVKDLLENTSMYVPNPEDWRRLRTDVMRDGLYNQNLQAIPPTGSISYINHSTASIHPVSARIERRKEGKLGTVYYPQPHLTNENVQYYQDAFEIGPDAILKVYAAAQRHVDQGMSLTLFYDDNATVSSLLRVYFKSQKLGIKTLYYSRLRQKALSGTEMKGLAGSMSVSRSGDASAGSVLVDDGEMCVSCAL